VPLGLRGTSSILEVPQRVPYRKPALTQGL
jgi:hypothetical protein